MKACNAWRAVNNGGTCNVDPTGGCESHEVRSQVPYGATITEMVWGESAGQPGKGKVYQEVYETGLMCTTIGSWE
jgi:hypothetical protein